MDIAGTLERAKAESWSDAEIVERVKSGETALYEILMRRYNQRLYRVALAILRNDAEAEDVMQDLRACLSASRSISGARAFFRLVDAYCGE